VFEASIPRASVNELGNTLHYDTRTRSEAASFLRALATLIEDEQAREEINEATRRERREKESAALVPPPGCGVAGPTGSTGGGLDR
jgi:hypothetical protein